MESTELDMKDVHDEKEDAKNLIAVDSSKHETNDEVDSIVKVPEHKNGPINSALRFVRSTFRPMRQRVPRFYFLLFKVWVPLLLMICYAIFCGHFLAVLESKPEKESNDEVLRNYIEKDFKLKLVLPNVKNSYDSCLEQYESNQNQESLNFTDLKTFLQNCTRYALSDSQKIVSEFQTDVYMDTIDSLTYDWNVCSENKLHMTAPEQAIYSMETFAQQLQESVQKNTDQYGPLSTSAAASLLQENSISPHCKVNSSAGALFWYTVMTTIGYGNTAPVTPGGRAMVFTLGFIGIVLFGAVISQASYTVYTIVDDAFRMISAKQLSTGYRCIFFWFSIVIIWILVCAGVYARYQAVNYTVWDYDYADLIWFNYITLTTVGFGDIFIPHDKFEFKALFYLPLLTLIGFVFLGIFIIKLSDKVSENIDHGKSLQQILDKQRLERKDACVQNEKEYVKENEPC